MKTTRSYTLLYSSAALLALWLVAGCSVDVQKDENGKEKKVSVESPIGDIKVDKTDGKDKHVSITSPFGNLKVDTDNVKASDIGLNVYPGSTIVPDDDHDQSKANVNISSPFFSLRVVALKYRTDDVQEKVWEFYKKDMKKYGRVLECKPGSPDMDVSKQKGDELTCRDDEDHNHKGVHMDVDTEKMNLRVGAQGHFRVVGFKPDGKGTQFSLVLVSVHGDEKEAN